MQKKTRKDNNAARDPAVDTRSATCISPATAEFRTVELMLFNKPHQTSSIVLQPGGRRPSKQHLYLNLVMCYRIDKNVGGHEIVVNFLSK